MKPLTQEWVEKAEGDFVVATQIMRRRKQRVYDAACFHTQQSVEKYFKARLCESNVSFPKTHDLVFLLKLLLAEEPLWVTFLPDAQLLVDYAVDFRYPGDTATLAEARLSLKNCGERYCREVCGDVFGLHALRYHCTIALKEGETVRTPKDACAKLGELTEMLTAFGGTRGSRRPWR